MDNQRLLVWAAFGLMLWFTWQAWMQDYGPAPRPAGQAGPASESPDPVAADPADLPELTDAAPADSPPGPQADDGPALEMPAAAPGGRAGAVVHVRTDVLDVEIDTRGGTLSKAALLKYPVHKDRPDQLVQLLSSEREGLGLIQSGLRSTGEGPEPNHLAQFESEQQEYRLGNDDELVVALTWSDAGGLNVVKRYRFERGSYIIGLAQTVVNDSGQDWRGASWMHA
jgi:YidC/Oxa1 family membrane protein insertase